MVSKDYRSSNLLVERVTEVGNSGNTNLEAISGLFLGDRVSTPPLKMFGVETLLTSCF